MKRATAAFLVACIGLVPFASRAGSSFDVGRVKVVLAEDGWEATEDKRDNLSLAINSGTIGVGPSVPGNVRVLSLHGANRQPLAVLLIRTTYGASGNIRMGGDCSPIKGLYVNDLTKGRKGQPECIIAGGLYKGETVVDRAMERLKAFRETATIDVPEKAIYVNGYFAINSGALIQVQALVAPEFKGLEQGQPGAELPDKFPPQVAAWGDNLGLAIRKALNSIGGELRMPPFEFR